MANALVTIFTAYLITLFLQLVGWPYLVSLTGSRLIDRGWALGRLATWLTVSLIIWFLGHLRLPANTTVGVWSALFILCLISGYLIVKNRYLILDSFKQALVFILLEELLFLIGLFFLSLTRGFNPAILDLEKFMDAGFMASYLRSPFLPAPDMWLAGETINYYTFGHFMGSIMTRFWLLPIALSYNILLGLIMGLSLSLSFSVVANLVAPLSSKKTLPIIFGGLMGAILVNVGGNTHTLWYFLKNHNWQGYWYADATRFIDRTIHEFPSYSYVVSDLHAHVWGLPLVLSFFIVLTLWSRALLRPKSRYYLGVAGFIGLLLGTFAMTSTWDALIYSLLTAIFGFVILFAYPHLFKRLLFSALIALPIAIFVALPWLIHFTSISEGIAGATEHSPLWQLFALWTGHLIMSVLAVGAASFGLLRLYRTKSPKTNSFPYLLIIALAVTAWLLLLLPEVVFFKDIYTGHPRANTMFKLTYQAFVIMSLTGGWVFGTILIKKFLPLWYRLFALFLLILIAFSVLLFPYFSYRDYYNRLQGFKGLNGYLWLEEQYPDDYQAIVWLNQNIPGQPVILETWGESYTTFDRVSSITGLPTVLGWRVHEWLWRGGFDIPGARTTDVDAIFNDPASVQARDLLNRYGVEYIFVGDKEREQYPNLDIEALKSLGSVVFESGQTFIVQLPTPNTYDTINQAR